MKISFGIQLKAIVAAALFIHLKKALKIGFIHNIACSNHSNIENQMTLKIGFMQNKNTKLKSTR